MKKAWIFIFLVIAVVAILFLTKHVWMSGTSSNAAGPYISTISTTTGGIPYDLEKDFHATPSSIPNKDAVVVSIGRGGPGFYEATGDLNGDAISDEALLVEVPDIGLCYLVAFSDSNHPTYITGVLLNTLIKSDDTFIPTGISIQNGLIKVSYNDSQGALAPLSAKNDRTAYYRIEGNSFVQTSA